MKKLALFLFCTIVGVATSSAHAAVITAFYGDNDGFGIGATSGTINPVNSNASPGEAPLTDVRLIAAGGPPFAAGPFNPTGAFTTFSVSGPITSAVLTLRTGSFDSAPALNPPNRIFLDGLLVDPAFINGFSSANTNNVETRNFSLDPTFFPFLADGSVSLAGTHLSEADGSGSFQVDFLSLTITTVGISAVPEPGSLILLAVALTLLGFAVNRTHRV